MEASKERREKYLKIINDIAPENLVYIDESGIDITEVKDRGWGKKGEKVVGKKSGKYYQRTNIIAGLVNNKSLAPMIFTGTCNSRLFEAWVEQFLVPELKPGQVVVMDNVAFHRSERSKDLIEAVGGRVIFLPPYSPDLNPIEKFWANMKRWIKGKITEFDKLYDALVHFFNTQTST